MINNFKLFSKFIIVKIIRNLLYVFKFFPIRNNRILFLAFPSLTYMCNPKYIQQYLSKNSKSNIDYIWIVRRTKDKTIPQNIKQIRYLSLKYFYYLCTSKVIINNGSVIPYLPLRKDAYTVYTWHGGGAYKKIELDMPIGKKYWFRKRILLGTKDVSYYLSSCEGFTINQSKSIAVDSKVFINTGMPRNDIFFDKKIIQSFYQKVRKKYSLSYNTKIILYAPTWRNDGFDHYSKLLNNSSKIFSALSKNTDLIILYRLHPNIHNKLNLNSQQNIINVANYTDMQELLCAADILITDYSSCMWDFSLMNKPCFIYATDKEAYNKAWTFYTPMSEWPFPIATNTDELINNILNFNQEEYVQKVKQHHKDLGSFEDGHACERVCKLIEDIIDGKVQK